MTEEKFSWKTIQKHLMTGIGYMIPIIVAATVLMGVIQLGGSLFGIDVNSAEALASSNMVVRFFAWVNQYAGPHCRGDLMFVVFTAYLAYSIAGRAGLAVGFYGGLLSTLSGAGFFGGIISGLLGGYFMKWLRSKLTVSRTYLPVMNFVVYPIIGTLMIFILCFAVVNPLGSFIVQTISSLVDTISRMGGALISFITAAGAAFDIGGPVSKGFLPISFQLSEFGFTIAPLGIGCSVPAIGYGIAVFIDRFVKKRRNFSVFDTELDEAGLSGFVLGALGVAEGGLPLLLSDPLVMIPINVLGGGIGAVLAYALGVFVPITAPPGFLGAVAANKPLFYFLAQLTGALVIAGLVLLRRYSLTKKRPVENAAESAI